MGVCLGLERIQWEFCFEALIPEPAHGKYLKKEDGYCSLHPAKSYPRSKNQLNPFSSMKSSKSPPWTNSHCELSQNTDYSQPSPLRQFFGDQASSGPSTLQQGESSELSFSELQRAQGSPAIAYELHTITDKAGTQDWPCLFLQLGFNPVCVLWLEEYQKRQPPATPPHPTPPQSLHTCAERL